MSNDYNPEWEETKKRNEEAKARARKNANDRESGTRNTKRTTSTNYQTDKRNQARSSGRQNSTGKSGKSGSNIGSLYADSMKYLDPEYFFGVGSSRINPKKGGKGGNNNSNNNNNNNNPSPREIYPVSQVQIPLGSGQVITPNLQEAYIREVTRLTLNLISSAENLLFAYNFSGINKIASYMLESDDASQRSTAVVSNIIRPRSGVELSELEVRDKLNNVINLVANTIGDLVPSSTKLSSFGQKKDNIPFQGGTPRIDNRTSFYDLELTLPDIQGFGYDVAYTIKCYDIS